MSVKRFDGPFYFIEEVDKTAIQDIANKVMEDPTISTAELMSKTQWFWNLATPQSAFVVGLYVVMMLEKPHLAQKFNSLKGNEHA